MIPILEGIKSLITDVAADTEIFLTGMKVDLFYMDSVPIMTAEVGVTISTGNMAVVSYMVNVILVILKRENDRVIVY